MLYNSPSLIDSPRNYCCLAGQVHVHTLWPHLLNPQLCHAVLFCSWNSPSLHPGCYLCNIFFYPLATNTHALLPGKLLLLGVFGLKPAIGLTREESYEGLERGQISQSCAFKEKSGLEKTCSCLSFEIYCHWPDLYLILFLHFRSTILLSHTFDKNDQTTTLLQVYC